MEPCGREALYNKPSRLNFQEHGADFAAEGGSMTCERPGAVEGVVMYVVVGGLKPGRMMVAPGGRL